MNEELEEMLRQLKDISDKLPKILGDMRKGLEKEGLEIARKAIRNAQHAGRKTTRAGFY